VVLSTKERYGPTPRLIQTPPSVRVLRHPSAKALSASKINAISPSSTKRRSHSLHLSTIERTPSPLAATGLIKTSTLSSKRVPDRVEELASAKRAKGVSFGPSLSPERFDESLPPSTPVKRGALPLHSLAKPKELLSSLRGLHSPNTPVQGRPSTVVSQPPTPDENLLDSRTRHDETPNSYMSEYNSLTHSSTYTRSGVLIPSPIRKDSLADSHSVSRDSFSDASSRVPVVGKRRANSLVMPPARQAKRRYHSVRSFASSSRSHRETDAPPSTPVASHLNNSGIFGYFDDELSFSPVCSDNGRYRRSHSQPSVHHTTGDVHVLIPSTDKPAVRSRGSHNPILENEALIGSTRLSQRLIQSSGLGTSQLFKTPLSSPKPNSPFTSPLPNSSVVNNRHSLEVPPLKSTPVSKRSQKLSKSLHEVESPSSGLLTRSRLSSIDSTPSSVIDDSINLTSNKTEVLQNVDQFGSSTGGVLKATVPPSLPITDHLVS
ncbi:unnamed protein product, partial [Protopolystoma xenopodis]